MKQADQHSLLCPHQVGEEQQFLDQGPGFIFLFHPALGPLWDVIAQKLRGGALAPRSEVVLEVRAGTAACSRLSASRVDILDISSAGCIHDLTAYRNAGT